LLKIKSNPLTNTIYISANITTATNAFFVSSLEGQVILLTSALTSQKKQKKPFFLTAFSVFVSFFADIFSHP